MKALCWHDADEVRVNDVPDPKIEDDRDAIVKITSTAICGSDLHIYSGNIPLFHRGNVLGHEFMGEVVESKGVSNLKKNEVVRCTQRLRNL